MYPYALILRETCAGILEYLEIERIEEGITVKESKLRKNVEWIQKTGLHSEAI